MAISINATSSGVATEVADSEEASGEAGGQSDWDIEAPILVGF
jgi:hypothetical protein